MNNTPTAPPAKTTTIQVTRRQRTELDDIQAELVVEKGRHQTLQDVMDALISNWRDHHERR